MKTGITKALVALGFFGIFAPTASAAYFDYAPAPRCDVQITSNLGAGSEGVEVTVLQNFLNRAGLLSAVPNGYFGPATTAAVRAFQARNYISTTGSVGPATRNAINERICDTNLDAFDSDYSTAYNVYNGYSISDVTYVDAQDPFVKVVTPQISAPAVYTNPGTIIPSSTITTPVVNPVYSPVTTPVIPATTNQSVASTQVIYASGIGYTYGITPVPGTLTINTPSANAVYHEGDTVNMSWTASNLSVTSYNVLLENSSTGQSKIVATTGGNSASFVLTKDVLDTVCGGACNNANYGTSYQNQFRFVVSTPLRDIAGNVSNFRAAVYPVTIIRPVVNFGTVSITTSKSPVNNGELFKLYVNIPTGASWDTYLYGQYSIKVRANCPNGVTASVAGAACGTDFTIPFAPTYFQQEIPVMAGNTTWYPQNVTFTLTVTNLNGQVINTATTNVTVNGAPFSW